ncbi:MAG: CoA transferase [Rhodococcus sp. (in: high G+C Gram-positive bacteria)]|uniref:CoA transferase n=1 Tax=Rhodococcus sp. TaxID=1831 RepID=UPI003BB17412
MTPDAQTSSAPLAGLRIVEVSSFVASPLCGLTLSQLGAEVIRVDPIGGASDYNRWPVTTDGQSIYWTGLNRGKRSVAVDMRSPEGQQLVQKLVTAPGSGGGILVTNSGGRDWMSHETLQALRDDVITLEILGRRDGTPAVDYTVNAGLGFPQITGPVEHSGVANHVLPAWDVACGLYAALDVTAAVRRRDLTGRGAKITLPLEDVALATAGTLGYFTEVQVNGRGREGTGNAVYGTYGIDFVTGDGGRFMIVALTPRHFRDLVSVTGVGAAVDALAGALGADFTLEADRFRHREVLTALFAPWFREHTADEVAGALTATSVLFERYRSFEEVVASKELENNPMFSSLEQPRIGTYLAAGHPGQFDGGHFTVHSAPTVGDDTDAVVRELLGD